MRYFKIIGEITEIEAIAVSTSIRDSKRLRRQFGGKRWRKLKGKAMVQVDGYSIRKAEIHWYEAHGIGKRKMKIKRFLD